MCSKQNFQDENDNFRDVIESCRFFGKFSNGVTLFILKILCFVILVDSFNIHIVNTLIVIDPYYILGIVMGCLGIYCLTALDIHSGEIFTQFLLQRIKRQVVKKINDDNYEPPIQEIAVDMIHIGYINQIFVYYIPVWFTIVLAFICFGQKMICIVFFGCFLLVLITCYPNYVKAELLIDMKVQWGHKTAINYEGVDRNYVGMLSFYVGNIYKNYGTDPHSKLLLLMCSALMSSQFLIKNTAFIQRVIEIVLQSWDYY